MVYTWLHWGEWIIIWDYFFFESRVTEHKMYAKEARMVESPSRGLAFLSMAMETTKLVSHQTSFLLHLSTRLLPVEW